MKRGGPLRRKAPLPQGVTPLARGAELKRAKGIARSKAAHPGRGALKPRSTKMAAVYRLDRVPAVQAALEADRPCEVGEIMGVAGINRGRSGAVFEPCHEWPHRGDAGWGFHERRKRSSAGSLVNPDNLLWSCSACNELIEDRPAMVREATGSLLIVREGDPEWDQLGRRADRGPA